MLKHSGLSTEPGGWEIIPARSKKIGETCNERITRTNIEKTGEYGRIGT